MRREATDVREPAVPRHAHPLARAALETDVAAGALRGRASVGLRRPRRDGGGFVGVVLVAVGRGRLLRSQGRARCGGESRGVSEGASAAASAAAAPRLAEGASSTI